MAGQLPPGFQIDPALSAQMGSTIAINPTTGKKIRWKDAPMAGVPEGAKGRPDIAPGAYETDDGSILKLGKSGAVQQIRGAQTAGADSRTRLVLGLGPVVTAQKKLFAEERWNQDMRTPEGRRGTNPHDELNIIPRGRDAFGGVVGNLLSPDDPKKSVEMRLSKQLGGARFRRYQQAASAFEAAMMPILSGSAVTDPEALRFLRSNLPQPGDDYEQLADKSKNRAMMANGAAKLIGEKPPFPRIPAMDLSPYVEREGMSKMPGSGPAVREPSVEAYIEGKPELGVGRSYGPAGGRAPKSIVIDIDGNPL